MLYPSYLSLSLSFCRFAAINVCFTFHGILYMALAVVGLMPTQLSRLWNYTIETWNRVTFYAKASTKTTVTTLTTDADQLKSLCMQLFRFIGQSDSLSNQHKILPFFCRPANLTFEIACAIVLMNVFYVFIFQCLI